MPTAVRRGAIGFHGGQVLSLRAVRRSSSSRPAQGAAGGARALARGRGRRRRGAARPRRRSSTCASNRTSTASASERAGPPRSCEPARTRSTWRSTERARLRPHAPEHVRDVRRFSRLGEHGALWLALGATGAAVDGASRARWVRATAAVAVAYVCSTSIKLVVGRRRPGRGGPAAPDGHADRPVVPVVARDLVVRRRARVRRRCCRACRCTRRRSRWRSRALYLGVHYPSDIAAGAALGTAIGSLGR